MSNMHTPTTGRPAGLLPNGTAAFCNGGNYERYVEPGMHVMLRTQDGRSWRGVVVGASSASIALDVTATFGRDESPVAVPKRYTFNRDSPNAGHVPEYIMNHGHPYVEPDSEATTPDEHREEQIRDALIGSGFLPADDDTFDGIDEPAGSWDAIRETIDGTRITFVRFRNGTIEVDHRTVRGSTAMTFERNATGIRMFSTVIDALDTEAGRPLEPGLLVDVDVLAGTERPFRGHLADYGAGYAIVAAAGDPDDEHHFDENDGPYFV